MAIKPILHRILIKPDDLDEKDEVFRKAKLIGIEIHRDERSREQAAIDTGTVIDVGPTAFKDFGTESPVKKNDKVVYAKYGGKAIVDTDGVKYVALNDEDIIALFTEEGA